jgi:transposase
MSKHTFAKRGSEESSFDVIFPQTRGSLREQAKQRRKLARVQGRLVVGVDLAREKQAISFSYQGQTLGRKRMECAPQRLADMLRPFISELGARHDIERAVIGLEPAGYYWELAAESFEAAGLDYVILHTLSVKRERETARFTPEKTDPRDADRICSLVEGGKFTDARLPVCPKRATLTALSREYLHLQTQSAAEVARLKSFWGRLLPEFEALYKAPDGVNALAIGRAMLPFSEMTAMTPAEWVARVKAYARESRISSAAARAFLDQVSAAHAAPHRRAGEGLPVRIQMCAERRTLLERQKALVAEKILARYGDFTEQVLLDSIPGSSPLFNAIALGVAGDFRDYDSARAVVKQAGSEVNEYQSGESRGRSRISHRGRTGLRRAAYQQAKLLVARNELFRDRFARLVSRMKRQQAYVAVGNSYLRIAHALVTRGEPWDPAATSRRM